MDIRRAWLLALVLISGARLDPAAAEPPGPGQVDPKSDLTELFPQARNIGLAIAITPDPHVPRYRRLFDLEIQAITLGMLNDGYVLDRYGFPWSDSIDDGDDSKKLSDDAPADESAFGLMVFRCDGWRDRNCQDPSTLPAGPDAPAARTTRIRAIYLVTDTATWGVSAGPLACATQRIREQLAGDKLISIASNAKEADWRDRCLKKARPDGKSQTHAANATVELLRFPGQCAGAANKPLVVLGPNFSGAMDSLGQQVATLIGPDITDLCLVSSTTTDSSNQRVEQSYPHLLYDRLATNDVLKLVSLAHLAQAFGYFGQGVRRSSEVAFLTEASTFGYGVCNPPTDPDEPMVERIREFCRSAQILYFPAAIADIRYGLDQQKEHQQNQVQTALKAALPSEHLTLESGAENGSEFPENRQSKLTAASQQLALDHVLGQLEQQGPKIVIVVATDVRDRLFLFDQLRHRLPTAMLIDLETDVLLAHPDFLHASRGAVAVASASLFVRWGNLFGCEGDLRDHDRFRKPTPLASWALDGQGILADAVTRLYDSGQSATELPCVLRGVTTDYGTRAPVLNVVTLKGMRQINRAFELTPQPQSWAARSMATRVNTLELVNIAHWMSVPCCLAIILPWVWMPRRRNTPGSPQLLAPREITLLAAVVSTMLWGFAMFAVYGGEDPESGYALLYWSVVILSLALWGLYQCAKRVEESRRISKALLKRYFAAISTAGAIACALAAAPLLAHRLRPEQVSRVMDDYLITRLALDIGQGLAYEVVVAVGVVTVLAVMVCFATGLCIMARNDFLLEMSAKCGPCKLDARTPRFPMAIIASVAALVALIAAPSLIPPLGGPRISIFGPGASMVATLVLVLTTIGASVLTAVAIHCSRRIRTLASNFGRCIAASVKTESTDPPAEIPGLWPANEWQPDLFAATPVVARVGSKVLDCLINHKKHGKKSWRRLIREFLGDCDGGPRIDDGDHRRAVFALLASEVSLYRWFVGGAVLCALASVCAVYLFPIEADTLLLWNLLLLIVHALLAGYVATALERDGVLSNILCNRPKKATFSAALFMYAGVPFFALGFAIAVSQVPGVVDWGGGILTLLAAVGIHP